MSMRALTLAAILLAAASAQAATPEPAVAPTPTQAEAAANRREADVYKRLIQANPDFRNKRMHLECDPIEDADLKRQCMDSFKN